MLLANIIVSGSSVTLLHAAAFASFASFRFISSLSRLRSSGILWEYK